jgi:uncharacterized membrane protein
MKEANKGIVGGLVFIFFIFLFVLAQIGRFLGLASWDFVLYNDMLLQSLIRNKERVGLYYV